MKVESRKQKAENRMSSHASRLTFHVPAATARQRGESRFTRHSSPVTRHSERGVALVVTLILLAVITFMAITFLVVTRSEKGSVTTQTDLTMARLAADTARERAIAEMLGPMLASSNIFNYGLLVSTNYININGFNQTGLAADDLRNINYDYLFGGGALNPNQQLQNLQNLFYNPRPPVFIVTNAFTVQSNEFRFYIDLNRNGAFDPTGFMPLTNALNQPTGLSAFLTGDPQWIGILQHPELFHSPTNLFTSRFAYLVVPIGETLDLNTMHNYAKPVTPPGLNASWSDAFLRNEGVLTAELNLAGFLVDLNTNLWPYPVPGPPPFDLFQPYAYYADLTTHNSGSAFEDAVALLRYRYATNLTSLATVQNLFGNLGANAFKADFMDGYSGGPLMTNTWWPSAPLDQDWSRVGKPWPGAENPNHFLSTQDLFDPTKTTQPAGSPKFPPFFFPDRLKMAGTNNDSYDRNTFYRLLSQLGTDSAPEPPDKMNLNYCNVDRDGKVLPNAATGFTNWPPAQFFTNALIRLMVDAGYTIGAQNSPTNLANLLVTNVDFSSVPPVMVTNLHIQIWPTNYYTPSLHRLLQIAANLYDATTNRGANPGTDLGYPTSPGPSLPTVFRPLFSEIGANLAGQRQVLVTNYAELTLADMTGDRYDPTGAFPPHDLSDADDFTRLGRVQPRDMVYNVPLVIGAKKGLPSFDEFTSDTQVQAARKLIYHRSGNSTDPTVPITEIDPAYYLTVTNVVGLQAWNSYANDYKRPVRLYAWPDSSVLITNVEPPYNQLNPLGYPARQPGTAPPFVYTPIWPGFNVTFPGGSFITPLAPGGTTNYVFMPTNSVYSFYQQKFVVNGVPDSTPRGTNWHVPHFQATVKTRLRFALVDASLNPPRLIDYVNLAANQTVDITTNLVDDGCGAHYNPVYTKGGMWCTNTDGRNPESFGARLQEGASSGSVPNPDWTSSLPDVLYGRDKDKGINRFLFQFGYGTQPLPGEPAFVGLGSFAAPYSPFRNMHLMTLWQANDPLVHYTVGDLQNLTDMPRSLYLDASAPALPPTPFQQINRRYEPWGGRPLTGPTVPPYDYRFKDPVGKLNGNSDAWDFTTNKFPNPGWLGRVHRGTPWQTVYLKSAALDYPSWVKWSGNNLLVTNYGQLAQNMPQWVSTTNIIGSVTNIFQWTYDSAFTEPTNDWRLVDLFSTALDPNATRGRLSINQANLAAWSAVLSGVIALTNSNTSGVDANGSAIPTPWVIPPAGVYDPDLAVSNTWPAIVKIVNAINTVRANTNNPNLPVFPNQVFHRLGELLSVPELTVASPFLSPNPLPAGLTTPPARPLSDAALERIPQQILGLLKCDETPRVVIYAFGQTLRPATHSRVTSGAFFGLVTNYQITAEVATRTVVRFDGVQPYQFGAVPGITNLHPVIESFTVLPPD